jgi:hypothetical protein
VRALAAYDGKLWAAGVGGEIWAYDGATWSLVKSGSWSAITDLVVYDGKLWAAVTLPFPAGGEVWYWDGATWTVDEVIAWPRAFRYLAVYGNDLWGVTDDVELYLRGALDWESVWDAGGGSASNMAVHDGLLWLARGPDAKVWSFDGEEATLEYDGSDGSAWAVASFGGELWVGLDGTYQIFRYDGVDWVEQDFVDFRRVSGFGVALGYLWIGTGWYARAYAWDGTDYVLDTQPADANRDDNTYVFCEYAGDLYLGTNIDGRVYVRKTA